MASETESESESESDLGRVQRVDGPSPELVVLSLRAGRDSRVLVFDARRSLLAWADERPRGDAADGFVRRLRKLLPGAALLRAERRGAHRRLRLRLRDGTLVVLGAEEALPTLRRLDDGFPLAGRRRLVARPDAEPWEAAPIDAAATAGSTLTPRERRRRELLRRLATATERVDRKLAAIERDRRRVDRVDALRRDAELILAHLTEWRPGAATLEVLDWYADPPTPRAVALDPRRTATEHAARLFHEAKRLERGAAIAGERAAKATLEREALAAWTDALATADDSSLDALVAQVEAQLGRPTSTRRDAPSARRAFRTFRGADDRPIHVGRSAADNDRLTLRAKPHDLWLHARGRRGAHVIVPLARGETCPDPLRLDAALLAAHFSEAAGELLVEVQTAARRHVHKPRGAAPGAVHVREEKTLTLRVDEARVRWLLEREVR